MTAKPYPAICPCGWQGAPKALPSGAAYAIKQHQARPGCAFHPDHVPMPYSATCTCGWTGKSRTEHGAQRALDRHQRYDCIDAPDPLTRPDNESPNVLDPDLWYKDARGIRRYLGATA